MGPIQRFGNSKLDIPAKTLPLLQSQHIISIYYSKLFHKSSMNNYLLKMKFESQEFIFYIVFTKFIWYIEYFSKIIFILYDTLLNSFISNNHMFKSQEID